MGSPPRMRGKAIGVNYREFIGGDHPRVCGEKHLRNFKWTLGLGSPPRMRGKVDGQIQVSIGIGITPAYAGKSPRLAAARPPPGDHPRVCGEKMETPACKIAGRGSPPRMRGKVTAVTRACAMAGITPAYAGKSWYINRQGRRSWDHPRVCGEKPISRCNGSTALRITPAYAGKSNGVLVGKPVGGDHPRVCGEKNSPSRRKVRHPGSPPRMRGKA